ncbi:unnamed protein product [Ascophyllum nodosum]
MVKRRRSTEPVQDQPDNTSMDGPSNSTPTARLDIEATNQRLPQPKSATVTGKEEDFEAAEELQAEEEGDAPVEKKKRKRTRTRKKRGKSGAAASTAPDGGTAVGDDIGAAGDGLGEGDGGYTRDKNGDGDKLPAGITDTVYVEGIPWTCSEEDVREFFKGCGKITAVRMPRWQDSGRPRGYAHVAFAGSSGARAAFGLDGQYLKGRYLTIQKPQEPATEKIRRANRTAEQPRGCQTVFVKNLPYDADEDGVREALVGCGRVASVRLAMWNHTRKLKGFGYVEFASERGAETCVRTQETLSVGGRPLVADFETGAPKGSFRRQDGARIKKTSADAGVGKGKPPKFKVHA